MSGNQRLDRLYPALTAKERALLVLRAWKADQQEDVAVRRTMPDSQGPEFNRYIELMNLANDYFGKYVAALKGVSSELNQKAAWLASLRMWGVRVWEVWVYIALHTNEPITESDHNRLVEEAQAEMVPVADLAETLVERYGGWTEADKEPAGEGEEPVVTNKAWNRVLAQKKKELTSLAAKGVLAGKRRGRGLLINNGSFYDWLGEPVPVCPEWGKGYDVFPDDQAGEVAYRNKARQGALDAIAASPASPILEALQESMGREVVERNERWDEATAALRERLREDTPWCWRELRAVETVLEEVAQEFNGEDPLLPVVRKTLDLCHKELADLPEFLDMLDVEVELPEPDEERVMELGERAFGPRSSVG